VEWIPVAMMHRPTMSIGDLPICTVVPSLQFGEIREEIKSFHRTLFSVPLQIFSASHHSFYRLFITLAGRKIKLPAYHFWLELTQSPVAKNNAACMLFKVMGNDVKNTTNFI
jgi:hypothetical protein